MKKIKIIIVIFCLILVLAPESGRVFAQSKTDEEIAAGVMYTAGPSAAYESTPASVGSVDEDFAQDLYETVYKRVRHESADKAVERVLADRKMSKDELFMVIKGADIGKIAADPVPSTTLKPDEMARRRVELQRALAEEAALADLMVGAMLDTEPTEIFANGDESDSGFDLLIDLDIIDAILFGKMESVLGGAGPGAPAGSNVIDLGAGRTIPAAPRPSLRKKIIPDVPGGGAGSSRPGAPSGSAGSQPPEASQQPIPPENFAACPADPSFNDVVEAYRAQERRGAAAGSTNAGGASGGGQSGSAGAGQNRGASGSGAGAGNQPGGNAAQAQQALTPEQPADWKRPLPCTETICLQVDLVYKTDSAYLVDDNCIACHFEKINDAFKKTFQHNLTPSKVTGNLIEVPKCKSSGFNLKQNFIIIKQPILTPPNDNLITKGDFWKNLKDAYEKYYDNPGRCTDGSAGGACTPDKNETEEAGENILGRTPENADQYETVIKIREEIARHRNEILKTVKQNSLDSTAQAQADQYRALMQEMDAMNSYFESFAQMYEELTSGDHYSPCKTLINKETCS